jgi:excinuclease ABC subunit C
VEQRHWVPDGGEHPLDLVLASLVEDELDAPRAEAACPGRSRAAVLELHAAAQALESIEIINQPLASIAKREEIIYVYGQEDEPVAIDHHSPVLHLVQQIRDEAHRFAVTFHRKRRQMRDRSTELLEIPGVGASTTRRLLEHFGSVQAVKQADAAALSAVVTRAQAEAIMGHFRK